MRAPESYVDNSLSRREQSSVGVSRWNVPCCLAVSVGSLRTGVKYACRVPESSNASRLFPPPRWPYPLETSPK
jgi:hypothetical protein